MFGKIISQIIYGVGLSFTAKYILENVLGILSFNDTAETQAIFFWVGAFCGLSFIWMYLDFKNELYRFICIFACYLLALNIPFISLMLFFFEGELDFSDILFQNIICLSFFFLIYLSIIIYKKILASQLTRKISEK